MFHDTFRRFGGLGKGKRCDSLFFVAQDERYRLASRARNRTSDAPVAPSSTNMRLLAIATSPSDGAKPDKSRIRREAYTDSRTKVVCRHACAPSTLEQNALCSTLRIEPEGPCPLRTWLCTPRLGFRHLFDLPKADYRRIDNRQSIKLHPRPRELPVRTIARFDE